MKFETIRQLRQFLDQQQVLTDEIKGRRLRKQLQALESSEFEQIKFRQFELTDIAIKFYVIVSLHQQNVELILRLDFEYPFNPPQIFYNETDSMNMRYCKDLLVFMLKDQNWGPSLTLSKFLQQFPGLASAILGKSEIPTTYHSSFEYEREELESSGIKLCEIEEYQWKYWIKNTKKKVLGLTHDCYLVFEPCSQSTLRLEYWAQIRDLDEIKAMRGKNRFQLEISKKTDEKKVTICYGGNVSNLDSILERLNPIAMIEREIMKHEKSGTMEDEEAIRCYSELIAYYSLSKPELSKKYIHSMKQLISKRYSDPNTKPQQQMHEIET